MADGPRKAPIEGVGGQAVIEGVMMKSPVGAAVASRLPGGGIVARRLDMRLLSDRGPIWSKPVFRGAATLVDTLMLGMKALEWSASRQEKPDPEAGPRKQTGRSGMGAGASMGVAFLVAVVVFVWLPLQLSRWLMPDTGSQVLLHLLAGLFRIVFFVAYLALISLMKDVRRVFVYHGAEHQCIHAYERGGLPVSPEEASRQSPLHQRCGTSFLLLLVIVTVLLYAIIDTIVILVTGTDFSPAMRIVYHLPLIPPVIGISYEVLRAADRHLETSTLARMLSVPGMFLQRMTTRRAGPEEAEVAIAALRLALDEDPGDHVLVEREEVSEARVSLEGAGD
ncbi:DUF1385 domain-containing protein [Candidatus Fermentibacterales bacterium]|nr:DUF1385 domain-containing protein [Candidatus Fermentibacterales bacterium]